MVGKVALTRTLSLLTGWNITGVWTAIYIAGPAYRVTVASMRFGCHLTPKTENGTRSEIESGTNKTISKTESRTRSE
ncbi:hypothetical protein MM0344_06260 [Helicobacter pylori]